MSQRIKVALLGVIACLGSVTVLACGGGDSVLFDDFTAADGCRAAVGLVLENVQEDVTLASPETDCSDQQETWRYRETDDDIFEFVVAVRCDRPASRCAEESFLFDGDDQVITCSVRLDPFTGSVRFRGADCF